MRNLKFFNLLVLEVVFFDVEFCFYWILFRVIIVVVVDEGSVGFIDVLVNVGSFFY